MTGKAVIKAAQMFTKTGQASRINVAKEIVIGAGLGLVGGLMWQSWHWKEAAKWEKYYSDLEKARTA